MYGRGGERGRQKGWARRAVGGRGEGVHEMGPARQNWAWPLQLGTLLSRGEQGGRKEGTRGGGGR